MDCPSCRAGIEPGARTCPACSAVVPVGPGSLIAGRFELLERLGAGGMGTVFRARDRQLHEPVAVKVLRLGREPQALERFHSEVRLARKVKHRNVCGVYEYGEDEDVVFCAMELVSGRNLRELLHEAPLPRSRAYEIALAAAAGLQAIHEAGVIHRDVKSANLMIDAKGETRLVDFGIAKSQRPRSDDPLGSNPSLTDSHHVVGSPEYMSPEQVRGLPLDPRSDIYSFGIVLYEVFTGRVPFHAETPVGVMAKHLEQPPPLDGAVAGLLPAELVPVLRRALAKEPGARYGSAAELARDLRAAQRAHAHAHTDDLEIADRETSERRRRLTERLPAWADPGRIADRMTTGALLGLAAFAVSVVGYLVLGHREAGAPGAAEPAPAAIRGLSVPAPRPTPDALPEPAPTLTPAASPAPRSSVVTPRPAARPMPAPTPLPTPAPTPAPTPTPTPTPTPAPTPTPTPALAASHAPPIPEPVRRPVLPTRGDVLSADDPEVVRPQCIDCPVTYSPQAERLRLEGDVVVALVVDEEGRVTQARLVRSDEKLLEEPALRSVRKWQYRPATKGGVPGKMHIEVTVRFRP